MQGLKALQFGKIPFETLKVAYFKVYDKEADPYPFFDATDEQIVNFLAKKFHETIYIIRIEEVKVLEVTTYVPEKRILDIDKLKTGISAADRKIRDDKVKELQTKYPGRKDG